MRSSLRLYLNGETSGNLNNNTTWFFIRESKLNTHSGYRSGGTRHSLGTAVVGSKESNNRNRQWNGTSGKREHGTVHSESCIYIPSTR